jgi:hypothetical protein
MQLLTTVTNGVPATKAFFPAKPAASSKPTATPTAIDPAAQIPTIQTGGAAQSLPEEIDLQAFFAAWGTNNESFDVTKDGTVDGQDLAVFLGGTTKAKAQPTTQEVLNSWGQGGGQGDANGDGVVDGFDLAVSLGNAQPPANDQTIQGVQKAWGSADPTYDLDGNGTVDGADLALALNGAQPKPAVLSTQSGLPATAANAAAADAGVAQAAVQAASQVANNVFALKDGDGDDAVALAEIPQAATLLDGIDADGSGAISRDELGARLARELDKVARDPQGDLGNAAKAWTAALVDRPEPRNAMAMQAYGGGARLADRLYQQLSERGFGERPPSNLRQLVGGVTSSRTEQARLLNHLSNKYPKGLAVSAKA